MPDKSVYRWRCISFSHSAKHRTILPSTILHYDVQKINKDIYFSSTSVNLHKSMQNIHEYRTCCRILKIVIKISEIKSWIYKSWFL